MSAAGMVEALRVCQCARVIVRFTLSKRRRKGVVRECNLCVHLSVEFEQVGAADVHAAHMSMPPPPPTHTPAHTSAMPCPCGEEARGLS
jgi:hypothetical protein